MSPPDPSAGDKLWFVPNSADAQPSAALVDSFGLPDSSDAGNADGAVILAAQHKADRLPTVDELANILYNENGGLAGEHIQDAATQMGYVVLNRARAGAGWGLGRGTASQNLTQAQRARIAVEDSPDAKAYAMARQAASDALRAALPDITEGAVNYNHRIDDATGPTPYSGAPSLLQYGPFNSPATRNHYVDIYGPDDRTNAVYVNPPYDSLNGPNVWIPRMPQRESQ
jgi:hypothetical protein